MLGLAPMLSTGVLSSGAAVLVSVPALLPVVPHAAAIRAVAPSAMAISVLRMGVYLAGGVGAQGRGARVPGAAVEDGAPLGLSTVGRAA